ncbi:MAG: hypothetical protein HN352_13980 [Bacteroidetes bacterium]|jgi:putative ABC transport system permease protein|nr:hypothetical protein [Bacteroidota bacterium]MBT4400573.1 hypothetical protein [Bacteroidota bacterium]MBT4410855.1 hypothetical protein [Bacteroidota bacterium]MBT7093718.1 hypothetical protein [Bacteroidota bacterium]MBT7464372.1 hypothetical protein [Bacteroidota bacterium]
MIIISALSQILRSLKANRVYNIINILGLSLGLASTFILLKIVLHEWNTDKFHENYEQIHYATIRTTPLSEPRVFSPIMFFNLDHTDYPEIKAGTEVHFQRIAEIGIDQNIYKTPLLAIDSTFPMIFNIPLFLGNYEELVTNPNAIILSKELSEKFYGTTATVGQKLDLFGRRFTVVGILDDTPGNSSFLIHALVSAKAKNFWSNGSVAFAQFNENADLKAFNDKIRNVGKDHEQFSESILEYHAFRNLYFGQDGSSQALFFQHGSKQSLKILFLIAFLLFAVSTFNYLNIYQVTLQKRAKEIGILCIHGAGRAYLARLFLKENIFSVGISALLVILIYSILSSYVPVFLGKNLPVYPVEDLILLLAISVLLILLSSSITSLRFNKIDPIRFIKELSTGRRALLARRISMTAQYCVTISLIVISLFFIKQLNFMLKSDMGFKQSRIISIPFFTRAEMDWGLQGEEQKQAYEVFSEKQKNQKSNQQFVVDEINKNPFLDHLCFGNSPLIHHTAPWKNTLSEQDYLDASGNAVTPIFKDLYGIQMVEGRFFEQKKDKSRGNKIVINQTAKRFFDIEDLTKSSVANRYWGAEKRPFNVIGVFEDFSFDHLSKTTQPLVLYYFDDKEDNDLMLEITEGQETASVEFLRNLYDKVNPGKTFSYHFVEDDVAQLYIEDKKMVQIYGIFTLIALIISSLGLYSFSIYDVQQRFKEIGIRKANGSGIWETVLFLVKPVFVLLTIAFIISVPVAWFGILKYLEGFAHKAPLSWWIFALAGLFTLLISVLTVITQSYRAASRNPVEALRYE